MALFSKPARLFWSALLLGTSEYVHNLLKRPFWTGLSFLRINHTSFIIGPSLDYVGLGTEWIGSEKCQYFQMFSTICADFVYGGWVKNVMM